VITVGLRFCSIVFYKRTYVVSVVNLEDLGAWVVVHEMKASTERKSVSADNLIDTVYHAATSQDLQ
jgi:hypothetical protein